jgi:methyl-accepting chemotaxis protein
LHWLARYGYNGDMKLNSIRAKIDLAALVAFAALSVASGLLMHNRMQNALEIEARAAAKRENALAHAYLDLTMPGDWVVENGQLKKAGVSAATVNVITERVGAMIDAKIAIYSGSTLVASNIIDENGSRLLGIEAEPDVVTSVLVNVTPYSGVAMILGEPYQAYYRPLYDSSKGVIGMFFVGIPRTTIGQSITQATRLFWIIVLSITAVFLVLLFTITSRLLKPVRVVADRLGAIAAGQGDLTAELPVTTTDEVGLLSKSYNSVMARLLDMLRAIKEVSTSGARTSEELAAHSQELSSTMGEIAATMRSIDSKNGQLHGEIVSSEGKLAKVEESVRGLAGLVEGQSAAVSQSSAAVRQTQAALESIERGTNEKRARTEGLAVSAREGEQAMSDMVSSIADISSRANSISEILTLLEGIAQQTGLLAMNAAIEAAHAGDLGKGFAVVAEEIRRLAEATSENSTIAADTISGIVESIDSASELSAKTGSAMSEMIRGASELAGSMQETLDGIHEIAEGSRQLTASLESLERISTESLETSRVAGVEAAGIRESFAALSSLAEENRAGISETSAGVSSVAESSNSLADLSTETSRNMGVLDDELSKFKTN